MKESLRVNHPDITQICPKCNHHFHPAEHAGLKRGKWLLFETQTYYDNRQITLAPGESRLLRELAMTPMAVSRIELCRRISVFNKTENDKLIPVLIFKIRNKLKDGSFPDPINTTYGLGYRFAYDE